MEFFKRKNEKNEEDNLRKEIYLSVSNNIIKIELKNQKQIINLKNVDFLNILFDKIIFNFKENVLEIKEIDFKNKEEFKILKEVLDELI